MEEKDLNFIKAKELAKKFKMKVLKKTHRYEYEKGVMYLYNNSGVDLNNTEFVLHNLAHFILSSPHRRNMPDFGLGNSPDSSHKFDPIIPVSEAEWEEQLTSYLSYLIAQEFEISVKNILKTEKCYISGRSFLPHLIAFGVIDENQKLTFKTRETADEY